MGKPTLTEPTPAPKPDSTSAASQKPVLVTTVTNLTDQKMIVPFAGGKHLVLNPHQERTLVGGLDTKNGTHQLLAEKGLVSFTTSTK